jgi:hypothetical protein
MSGGIATYIEGITPAEISISSPTSSIVGDAILIYVVHAEPAKIEFTGILPAALSGNVSFDNVSVATISLTGILPNQISYSVAAPAGSITAAGVVPDLYWSVTSAQASIELTGKSPASVSAAVISIPTVAAVIEVSGASIDVYTFEHFQIFPPVGEQYIEGGSSSLSSIIYNISGKQSFSGLIPEIIGNVFLLTDPAEATLSGIVPLAVHEGVLVGSFDLSLRPLSMSCELSKEPPWPMSLNFPSLNLSMHRGSSFSSDFPSLEITFSGTSGHSIEFVNTLPGLNLEAFAAGYLGVDLPMFTQAMSTTASVLARINATFPSLGLNGIVSIESVGDLTGTFPSLKMNVTGLAGAVVELTASFKPFTMMGTIIPGQVGDLEMTLPKMTSSITSVRSGPIEIDGTFSQFTMKLSSGSITAGVLRYQVERIR